MNGRDVKHNTRTRRSTHPSIKNATNFQSKDQATIFLDENLISKFELEISKRDNVIALQVTQLEDKDKEISELKKIITQLSIPMGPREYKQTDCPALPGEILLSTKIDKWYIKANIPAISAMRNRMVASQLITPTRIHTLLCGDTKFNRRDKDIPRVVRRNLEFPKIPDPVVSRPATSVVELSSPTTTSTSTTSTTTTTVSADSTNMDTNATCVSTDDVKSTSLAGITSTTTNGTTNANSTANIIHQPFESLVCGDSHSPSSSSTPPPPTTTPPATSPLSLHTNSPRITAMSVSVSESESESESEPVEEQELEGELEDEDEVGGLCKGSGQKGKKDKNMNMKLSSWLNVDDRYDKVCGDNFADIDIDIGLEGDVDVDVDRYLGVADSASEATDDSGFGNNGVDLDFVYEDRNSNSNSDSYNNLEYMNGNDNDNTMVSENGTAYSDHLECPIRISSSVHLSPNTNAAINSTSMDIMKAQDLYNVLLDELNMFRDELNIGYGRVV
eukprot:gene12711-26772_t